MEIETIHGPIPVGHAQVSETAVLKYELGRLREEFADFRNSLPTIIAKQIESYMLRLENDD